MKKAIVYFFALLLFFPLMIAFGNMEIGPYDATSAKGYVKKKKTSDSRRCRRGPFIMYPGSLKNNIERLARNYCWYVVKWNADSDFNWAGSPAGTTIRAGSLQDALRKILGK